MSDEREQPRQQRTHESIRKALRDLFQLDSQERIELLTDVVDKDMPVTVQKEIAVAMTQDLSQGDKIDIAMATTQELPLAERKAISMAAIDVLPPEEKKDVLVSEVRTLPPGEHRKAVAAEAARLSAEGEAAYAVIQVRLSKAAYDVIQDLRERTQKTLSGVLQEALDFRKWYMDITADKRARVLVEEREEGAGSTPGKTNLYEVIRA